MKKSYSVTIKDSYLLLPHCLRDLADAFELAEKKSYFPFKFMTKQNMGYIGVVPEKAFETVMCLRNFMKIT